MIGPGYTCITFFPDLSKFGMNKLDRDIQELMMKRVFDVAGITDKRVKTFLNGKRLAIKDFQDYVNLYMQVRSETKEKLR